MEARGAGAIAVYAMFDDPPSYKELAARFTVPYGRRLAELRSLKGRKVK
jgi:hypothetical protein